VSIRISIPNTVRCERLDALALPQSWRDVPFPQELWAIGDKWLLLASSVCLLAPSAVVPEELNLLINPLHPDFKHLQFLGPSAFNFDPRMWKIATPRFGPKSPKV
jgi:RES domain-containing protein